MNESDLTVNTSNKNVGLYRRPLVYTNCEKHLPPGDKYVAVNLLNSETLFFVVEAKSRVKYLFTQVIQYLGINENAELFGLCIRSDANSENNCSVSNESGAYLTIRRGKYSHLCTQRYRTCSEECIFLDPDLKLHKYTCKQWKSSKQGVDIYRQPLLTVLFRVQFFVDSYLFLSDKLARHQYYLQLRSNVINFGLTSLTDDRAFLLASLAMQADFGNYDPVTHIGDYFNPDDYFPLWIIAEVGRDYIIKNMPSMHRDQRGLTRNEAEGMYIKEASDTNYSPHNMLMYRLRKTLSAVNIKKQLTPNYVWIGVRPFGIEIYEETLTPAENLPQIPNTASSTKAMKVTVLMKAKSTSALTSVDDLLTFRSLLSAFHWLDIGKLHFDKKKFEIRSISNNSSGTVRKFTYYSDTEAVAKNLLTVCRYTHTFQLLISSRIREMKKRELQLTKKYREVYVHGADEVIDDNCSGSVGNINETCVDGCVGEKLIVNNVHIEQNNKVVNKCGKEITKANATIEKLTGYENSEHIEDSEKDFESTNLLESRMNWTSINEQRISVISSTSSNTTSGIVSDRVHSVNGDSEADDLADYNDHMSSSSIGNSSPTVSGILTNDDLQKQSLFQTEPNQRSLFRSSLNTKESHADTNSDDLKIKVTFINPVINNIDDNMCSNKKFILSDNCNQHQPQQYVANNDSSAESTRSTSSDQSAATIKTTITPVVNNRVDSLQLSTSPENSNKLGDGISNNNNNGNDNYKNTNTKMQNVIKAKPIKLPMRSESLHHTYENIPFFMTNNHLSHIHRHQHNQQYYHPNHNHLHINVNEPYNYSNNNSSSNNINQLPFSSRNATRIGVSSLVRNCGPKLCDDYAPNSRCRCQNVYTTSVCGSEPDLYNSKLWSPTKILNCDAGFQSLPGTSNNSSELLHQLRVSPPPFPSSSPPMQSQPHSHISVSQASPLQCLIVTSVPSVPPPPYKPIRTNSDPAVPPVISTATSNLNSALLSPKKSPTINQLKVETKPVVSKRPTNHNYQQLPTFHRSMNNLVFIGHPLRLVESEMNVNLGLIPPPYEYSNETQRIKYSDGRPVKPIIYGQMLDGRPKATSEQHLNAPISDLHQLKQKSQNMDLPLINALFNDKSLVLPKTVATCQRKPRPKSCAITNIQQQQLKIEPRQSCSYLDVSNKSLALNNNNYLQTTKQNNGYQYMFNDTINDMDISSIKYFANSRLGCDEQMWPKHQLYA